MQRRRVRPVTERGGPKAIRSGRLGWTGKGNQVSFGNETATHDNWLRCTRSGGRDIPFANTTPSGIRCDAVD